MSNQPIPTITVQDPQNSPLRLGETPLARTLKDSQEKQERDSRLGKNIVTSKSVTASFTSGLQGAGGGVSPYFWGSSPGQFKGMFSLPSLETLKLNNLNEFRLTLNIAPFQAEIPDSITPPSSSFTCPINFLIAKVETVYTDTGGFGFQPIFAKNITSFSYDIINGITLTGISESFNLLDYTTIDSRSGTGINTLFNFDPSQITESQAQDIFDNGGSFIYGLFIDTSALTGDNAIYMNNNLIASGNTIWLYSVYLTMAYTGIQAVI